MNNSQDLIISKEDYDRILSLVSSMQNETSQLLEEELERARIVQSHEKIPTEFVSMGSVVTFLDENTKHELTLKLVYPNDVHESGDIKKISILAPVGAALIGLKVGQGINWPLPNGKTKHLKVIAVKSGSDKI